MANTLVATHSATFHPFPRLPKELRVRVWRLHLRSQRSRALKIKFVNRFQSADHVPYLCTSSRTPPLLHTCVESRLEALHCYTQAFRHKSDTRYIWTSFDMDIIWIGYGSLCELAETDKAQIQHLIARGNTSEHFFDHCRDEFRAMPKLRTLELWSPENAYEWTGTITTLTEDFDGWFGHLPGYVCPEIKIFQEGAQWELNAQNEEVFNTAKDEFYRFRDSLRGGEYACGGSSIGGNSYLEGAYDRILRKHLEAANED